MSDEGENFTIVREFPVLSVHNLTFIDNAEKRIPFYFPIVSDLKHVPFAIHTENHTRHFSAHDDYLIVENINKVPKHFYYDSMYRISEVAIVVDTNPKTDYETRLLNFWRNFSTTIFPLSTEIKTYFWPPIFTRECPTSSTKSSRDRDKERSIGLIHDQLWEDYYRRRPLHSDHLHQRRYKDEVMVVFENDAICRVEDCASTVAEEISKMTSDLRYIGWCCDENSPQCTHAYVTTRAASGLMHSLADKCGAAIDLQMREFYLKKQVTTTISSKYKHFESPCCNVPTHGVFTQGEVVPKN